MPEARSHASIRRCSYATGNHLESLAPVSVQSVHQPQWPACAGAFSRQTQSLKVPETSKGPGRIRARPAGAAAIDPGKVPTLQQLGLAPPRSSLFLGGELRSALSSNFQLNFFGHPPPIPLQQKKV